MSGYLQCDVCLREYDSDFDRHVCDGPGDRLSDIEERSSRLEAAVVALGRALSEGGLVENSVGNYSGALSKGCRERIEAAIKDLRRTGAVE